jgi:hypothetical protein
MADDVIETPQSPLLDDKLPAGESPVPLPNVVPEGLFVNREPIPPVKAELDKIPSKTLCGSPMTFVWKVGPWRGQALRMYCAEPFCVESGSCSGAMFVPSDPQFTRPDPDDPVRRRRAVSAEEVIAGARWCARKATAKDDPRSDQQIARYAGKVLAKSRRARKGAQWRT